MVVWGRRPSSRRGRAVAHLLKSPLISIEDAFLRSVKTGRQGEAPLGLVVDKQGIYFDSENPSDLTNLIHAACDAPQKELAQAKAGMALLRRLELSKYNSFEAAHSGLPKAFILVIDQTFGDASIRFGAANKTTFSEMLDIAQRENPGIPVLVKTHPETSAGLRSGYFDKHHQIPGVIFTDQNISPWWLFSRAKLVYCVTSQMGLEAIFYGHRPVIFGNPFYAGWELSDDRNPATDSKPGRSAVQVFWAAYLKYPLWYNSYFDRQGSFESTALALYEQAKTARIGENALVFLGARLWKRGFLRRFFPGTQHAPRFFNNPEKAIGAARRTQAQLMVWAGQEDENLRSACHKASVPLLRMEDGFLRSSGLGAKLIPPVSLALDDLGIYYDATRPSRLEILIGESLQLTKFDHDRAEKLQQNYVAAGLSKYNLPKDDEKLDLPKGRTSILIPGQVEDDASIKKGAGKIRDNLSLVQATRAANPDAYLIYKPHPDVEAGLRPGTLTPSELSDLVDHVAINSDITQLLQQVNAVSTITSLTGFEALLHGKVVTCYGMPFYAGWGLTDDTGQKQARRKAKLKTPICLTGLIHACLIDYPRYWDPISGKPCPVEIIVERFSKGQFSRKSHLNLRLLAKMQGLFASYAWLWR